MSDIVSIVGTLAWCT